MKVKKRLDVLLTEQGYAESRAKAQAIIMSGLVYVNGQKADKPGMSFEETVELELPEKVRGQTDTLIGNYPEAELKGASVCLRPYECLALAPAGTA